jgi:hypothetical protein
MTPTVRHDNGSGGSAQYQKGNERKGCGPYSLGRPLCGRLVVVVYVFMRGVEEPATFFHFGII